MTTLFNLIDICLRRFLAPFLGKNQPAALVLFGQAAIKNRALLVPTELTPARPIHAPTLRPSA
jgi:hypothetical protein